MNPPDYSKIHPCFKMDGSHYDRKGLKDVAMNLIKEGVPFERVLGDFILDWLSPSSKIVLQTSGTTSAPKRMELDKQAMVNSTIATGAFFGLTVGHSALLCLPTDFIAGKMMLIRAIVLGLSIDLVEPCGRPLVRTDKSYDFVAMTPFQVVQSLTELDRVKTLIIGGGALPSHLRKPLLSKAGNAYETYGMTETLSHIAVRKMNDPICQFTLLPNIFIRKDDRNCMVIDAPHLSVKGLTTNDEIEILDKQKFRLIGRVDNIVNSGGVKLNPEQIEVKLSNALQTPFFIAGIPDDLLGERLVLALEGNNYNLDAIRAVLKKPADLKKFETPKTVLIYSRFERTSSGKINRKKTLSNPCSFKLNL